MKNIIKKQYHKDEVWFHMEKDMIPKLEKKKNINQLKCVGGHCWFGVHQNFSKPFKYFTMLRNPLERVISEYYYILERPNHKAFSEVKTLSLSDFIQHFPVKSSNQQTRRLSGLIHKPDLDLAKFNLTHHFEVAGIAEMFNESVYLMKKVFGWNDIEYQKANVTKTRPSMKEIPSDILKELEDRNQMDIELYEFAKTELINQLASLNPISRGELDIYLPNKKV